MRRTCLLLCQGLAATVFSAPTRGKTIGGRGSQRRSLPVSFGAKHGIENNERLAHAGRESRFALAAEAQRPIESSDGGIAADCRDGGHDRTRLGSARPPPDAAAAARVSALTVNGAKPAKAAFCLRLSLPNSGRWARRVLDNTRPTPRQRTQQPVTFAPERSVTNHGAHFVFETGKPLLQAAIVLLSAWR